MVQSKQETQALMQFWAKTLKADPPASARGEEFVEISGSETASNVKILAEMRENNSSDVDSNKHVEISSATETA